jgi:hypothetical protein
VKLDMSVRGGRSGVGKMYKLGDSESSWLQSARKAGMECNLLNISQREVFLSNC